MYGHNYWLTLESILLASPVCQSVRNFTAYSKGN